MRPGAPPRVVIVGSGAWFGVERSYERAFAELGVPATVVDYVKAQSRYGATLPSKAARFGVRLAGRRLAVAELMVALRRARPTLVFIVKSDDLPTWAYPALRRAAPGARLAAYHPDSPYSVSFLHGPAHRRARAQMHLVDDYYSWSEPLLERFRREEGVPHARRLSFGVDPVLIPAVTPTVAERERFAADVSFVGNWDEKREAWLRPLVRSGLSVAIYGDPYWQSRVSDARVRAAWRGIGAFGEDFTRAVLSSKVTVNVLRTQNEGAENMRTYEAPGCGGLMLAEHSAQQAAVFRPEVEAMYARTSEEMVEIARRIVAWPEERRVELRRAAWARSREHLYVARARQLLAECLGVEA